MFQNLYFRGKKVERFEDISSCLHFFIFLHYLQFLVLRFFLVFIVSFVSEIDRDERGRKYVRTGPVQTYIWKRRKDLARAFPTFWYRRSAGDFDLHSPLSFVPGRKLRTVTKTGRFNLQPSRKVSPSYRFLLARSYSADSHRFRFSRCLPSPRVQLAASLAGQAGQKERRQEVRQHGEESTENSINGGVSSKDRLYLQIYEKEKGWEEGEGELNVLLQRGLFSFAKLTRTFLCGKRESNSAVTRGKENNSLALIIRQMKRKKTDILPLAFCTSAGDTRKEVHGGWRPPFHLARF